MRNDLIARTLIDGADAVESFTTASVGHGPCNVGYFVEDEASSCVFE